MATCGEDASEEDDNGAKAKGDRIVIREFHEVRTINSGLEDLAELGFDIESLIPQDRTGIEEPRYVLRRGDNEIPLGRSARTAARRPSGR